MRTTVFNQYTPPANVYEFRLAPDGSAIPQHKKEKKMENETNVNVDTIADQMALATELDVTKLSDEELELILANSPEQFTQDDEDVNPLGTEGAPETVH